MYNENYFAKIKMAKFPQKYKIIFRSKFPDISITENFRSSYPPNPGANMPVILYVTVQQSLSHYMLSLGSPPPPRHCLT